MDAPCEIQGSIHVFRLVNNMCPGKWVHIKVIKMKKLFLNLEVSDGYPPVSMESIWAEVTEEGYLKVNNIPFYSKEISFGDACCFNVFVWCCFTVIGRVGGEKW